MNMLIGRYFSRTRTLGSLCRSIPRVEARVATKSVASIHVSSFIRDGADLKSRPCNDDGIIINHQAGNNRRFLATKPNIQRAYPQYSVFGDSCALTLKLMAPSYKLLKGQSLVADASKRGRILLEFTPRSQDGAMDWNTKLNFALSPEEVGFICSQLPEKEVELSRRPAATHDSGSEELSGVLASELPDKVLKISPSDGEAVSFCIDYVKDGVGGKSPGPGQETATGPLEVVVQAGEYAVITSIFQSALPYLVGWSPLMEMNVQTAINSSPSS